MAHKDPHVQREESQHIAPQQSRPNLPTFSNSTTISVGHVGWMYGTGNRNAWGGPVQWEAQQFPGLRTLPDGNIYIGEASHAKCAHTPAKPSLNAGPGPCEDKRNPNGNPDGAVFASLLIRFGLERSEY
ncbi:hypothetical protein BDZ97DRAFT_1841549, partial [Flammula alnicola]